jgi:hypothetical protein
LGVDVAIEQFAAFERLKRQALNLMRRHHPSLLAAFPRPEREKSHFKAKPSAHNLEHGSSPCLYG